MSNILRTIMRFETYFDSDPSKILGTDGLIFSSLILLICGLPVALYFLRRRKYKLPPGPIGLPFLGYLPFLGKEPFKTLDNLCKKYGYVFSLYLGRKYAVILGNYDTVKEAFSKPTTIDRPEGIFDFMPDALGITNFNGAKWTQQRRFFTRTMKDAGFDRSSFEQLLEDEISDFLKLIASKKGAPVDLKNVVSDSVSNTINSLVLGKRLPPGPEADIVHGGVHAIAATMAPSALCSTYPLLANILVKLRIGKYHKLYSQLTAINGLIKKEIEMRKKASDDSGKSDFIIGLIEAVKNHDGKLVDFNEGDVVGNIQALFAGGTDTTSISMMWLLLAMTAYPHIQKKVHLEVDSVLGRESKASWETRINLPYTYAVIMESQRWKTIGPLSVPRIASEDTKIGNYDVPKGSLIIPNLYALHNDSRYWKNPESFIPERFLLNEGKDINHKLESYAPFSYGKRRCPGENVALMEIFLYFTSIMQHYEIRVPNGAKPKLEGVSCINYVPVAQDICFIPR